jgi:hypothetical protein
VCDNRNPENGPMFQVENERKINDKYTLTSLLLAFEERKSHGNVYSNEEINV